jgi:hypothetical protein
MKIVKTAIALTLLPALAGCTAYDSSSPGSQAVYEALQGSCGNLGSYSQEFVENGANEQTYWYKVEAGGQVGEVLARYWVDSSEWTVTIFDDEYISKWGCSDGILRWND